MINKEVKETVAFASDRVCLLGPIPSEFYPLPDEKFIVVIKRNEPGWPVTFNWRFHTPISGKDIGLAIDTIFSVKGLSPAEAARLYLYNQQLLENPHTFS